MSQPRASRRGGKVAVDPLLGTTTTSPGTVTPVTEGVVAPPSDPAAPAAKSTEAPPVASVEGASLLKPSQPSDVTAHFAIGGVVRSRGSTMPVRDVKASVPPSEVAAKVSGALSGIVVAAKTQPNSADKQPSSLDTAPVHTLKRCDVLLVSQADAVWVPCKVVQTDVAPNIIIASVEPETIYNAIEATGNAVGWIDSQRCSSEKEIPKLWVASYETAIKLLAPQNEPLPFTHVVLTDVHTGTLEIATALALCHTRMQEHRMPIPKLVLCGSGLEVTEYAKLLTPLEVRCVALSGPSTSSITRLSVDDIASITDLPIRRPASKPLANDLVATLVPHPKIAEHQAGMCAAMVRVVISSIPPESPPLLIVVYSAAIGELVVRVKRTCGDLIDVATALPSVTLTRHTVVVLGHALSDQEASSAYISVVVDSATEKSYFQVNKGECIVPAKRVEWESIAELNRRARSLGWKGPGLLCFLGSDDDAKSFVEKKSLPSQTNSVDGIVLRLLRFGIPPPEVLGKLRDAPSQDLQESALWYVTEQSTLIPNNKISGNNFLNLSGEIIARLPLPPESATLAISGLVVGLESVMALIAVLSAHPLRSTAPNATEAIASWLEVSSQCMSKMSCGHSSDIIADATLYCRWLQEPQDRTAAFCASCGVTQGELTKLQCRHREVLNHLSDYSFVLERTPSQLEEDIHNHAGVIEMFLAVALARRALLVKADGSITNASAAARPLFLKTSKEACPNGFLPSAISWRNGCVIVPSVLKNTTGKMFASSCTMLDANCFFSSLILLHPAIEYATTLQPENQQVVFTVQVNHQHRKFRTDRGAGARILEFRQQWLRGLQALAVKRAMPADVTASVYHSALRQQDRRLVLDDLRQILFTELRELITEVEIHEAQTYVETQNIGSHAYVAELPEGVRPPSDIAAIHSLLHAQPKRTPQELLATSPATSAPPIGTSPPCTAPSATPVVSQRAVFVEDDDDVEIEGQNPFLLHGPIVEDD